MRVVQKLYRPVVNLYYQFVVLNVCSNWRGYYRGGGVRPSSARRLEFSGNFLCSFLLSSFYKLPNSRVSYLSTCLSKSGDILPVLYCTNLGLTQLLHITELVNPGDVQLKVLDGTKEYFFRASVSVGLFIAAHGYEQGRIYSAVTCLTSILYTCNQFTVVPYHFWIFKFGRQSARQAGSAPDTALT